MTRLRIGSSFSKGRSQTAERSSSRGRYPLIDQVVGDDVEAIAEPRHGQRSMADDRARSGCLYHRRHPVGLPGIVESSERLARCASSVVVKL